MQVCEYFGCKSCLLQLWPRGTLVHTCTTSQSNIPQQDLTHCKFCNSPIHHACSDTNAKSLNLQTSVCTACIDRATYRYSVDKCFNYSEEAAQCTECFQPTHRDCLDKLQVPHSVMNYCCHQQHQAGKKNTLKNISNQTMATAKRENMGKNRIPHIPLLHKPHKPHRNQPNRNISRPLLGNTLPHSTKPLTKPKNQRKNCKGLAQMSE